MNIDQSLDILHQVAGRVLLSTYELYWQSDDDSGQLLEYVELKFDNGYLNIHAMEEDDSIEISIEKTFQPSKKYTAIHNSDRWGSYIGKKMLWGRLMINNNGYFDGIQLEFKEDTKLSQIQLICMASELHMYVCEKVK